MNPSHLEGTPMISARSIIIFQTIAVISSHCTHGSLGCTHGNTCCSNVVPYEEQWFSLSSCQSFLLSSSILSPQSGLVILYSQSDSRGSPSFLLCLFLYISFLKRPHMIPLPGMIQKIWNAKKYLFSWGILHSIYDTVFRLQPITTNVLTYRI